MQRADIRGAVAALIMKLKGEKLCCAAPTLFNINEAVECCDVLKYTKQMQVDKNVNARSSLFPIRWALARSRARADRATGHVFAMISRRPGENPGRIRSYKKKLCVKKRNSQDKNRNM